VPEVQQCRAHGRQCWANKNAQIDLIFDRKLARGKRGSLVKYELEQARKQIVDQISRDGWGFDGVFSKRTQREIYSDHDQELHRMSVRSDPKSLLLHKSTSNRTHIKRTQGISTKPQENEKGATKNTRLQKFQQGYKL
jgi:hypothetical protein